MATNILPRTIKFSGSSLRRECRTFTASSARRVPQTATAQWAPIPGPPLYERRPQWWARWAWGLLALDMVFTTTGCDTIMKHWTQEVVKKPSTSSSASSTPSSPTATTREWELRPFWQRFGLSVAQVLFGAAAGALIMATRERAVKTLRFVHAIRAPPAPASHGQAAKAVHAHRAAAIASSSSSTALSKSGTSESVSRTSLENTTASASSTASTLTRGTEKWVEVETASGKIKHFMKRHVVLSPGRDATEMILQIAGARGHFWIGLNGSKILGFGEGTGRKGLKEGANLRRDRFLAGWEGKPLPSSDGGWVSGPVAH